MFLITFLINLILLVALNRLLKAKKKKKMESSQSQVHSSNEASIDSTTLCSQGETTPTSPRAAPSPSTEKISDQEKNIVYEKLMSGNYATLNEMATDINGGHQSKVVEDIIFKNMMKIMIAKFNA